MKNVFKMNRKIMISIIKAFLLAGLLWLNFARVQSAEKQNIESVYRLQNHAVINQTHQTLPDPETGVLSKKPFSIQSTMHSKSVNFLKTKRLTRPLSDRLIFAHYHVKKGHHTKRKYTFSRNYTITPLQKTILSSVQQLNSTQNDEKRIAVKLLCTGLTTSNKKVTWRLVDALQAGVTITPKQSQTDENGVASTVIKNTVGGAVKVIAIAPDMSSREYVVPFPDSYEFTGNQIATPAKPSIPDSKREEDIPVSITIKKNDRFVGGVCITWKVSDPNPNDAWITHESCTNNNGVATAYVTKATTGTIKIVATSPDTSKTQNGDMSFIGYALFGKYFVIKSNTIDIPAGTATNVSATLMNEQHQPQDHATIKWESADSDVVITAPATTTTGTDGVSTVAIKVTHKTDHKVTISYEDGSGNSLIIKTINIKGT